MEVNIKYALKPVLQVDRKINEFWQSVSSKFSYDLPDVLGGGTMDGFRYWSGDLGKLTAAKAEESYRVYDVAKREITAAGSTEEIEKVWKRIGMDGSSHGMNKGEIYTEINRRRAVEIKGIWQDGRNANVSASIAYSEHMATAAEELGGKGITSVQTVFTDVNKVQTQALGFDAHLPHVMVAEEIGVADRFQSTARHLTSTC
jgi:hypothetical protein